MNITLDIIPNNTGYTGVQFMNEFHSHSGIILNIDHGVMTVITHGSRDGTLEKRAIVERLIEKYGSIYQIKLVCCYSHQILVHNWTLAAYIKYPKVAQPIRMNCHYDGIIKFEIEN